MSRSLDVALATCRVLPEPDFDREPLDAALEAAGLRAAWLAWDDPASDWSVARMAVLRSTWNYPRHYDAFVAWLERTAGVTRLVNPLDVVRESLHKSYLLRLEADGIPVTPTELVERGSNATVGDLLARRGWEDAVIKPAVSAASWRTLRVSASGRDAAQRHLDRLAAEGDVLVQAYLPSVEDHGERAIVAIDGTPTHAVRKTPRFSGEDESVSESAVPIGAAERDLAERVLSRFDEPPLYARVDVAPGADGAPVVMELETVEPSLFFDQSDEALRRFVDGIARRLA